MRKSILLLVSLACLLTFSCKKHAEYPGYSVHNDSIWFKLVKIGEDSTKACYNDYVTVDISYQTLKDSVFFSGRRKFQITKPDFTGSIDECMTLLEKDDSASFIIDATRFFKKTLSSELPPFLKKGERIKINVSVLDIQTPQQFEQEKEAFLKWIEDFGEYERTLLTQYIQGAKIKAQPTASGLYYISTQKGTGPDVAPGDTVVVHYEGRFLNGKFFDSTRQRNDPFQFVYGQQWQVVKGLEEAIGMMHEGEKAIFIIPSELAFGQDGSSTGIIPPFTSTIFEVELISVKKK
jgi:FKBP-type peptidyl-prolyl cis-trans isomerase